jgi:hypothetical protein
MLILDLITLVVAYCNSVGIPIPIDFCVLSLCDYGNTEYVPVLRTASDLVTPEGRAWPEASGPAQDVIWYTTLPVLFPLYCVLPFLTRTRTYSRFTRSRPSDDSFTDSMATHVRPLLF